MKNIIKTSKFHPWNHKRLWQAAHYEEGYQAKRRWESTEFEKTSPSEHHLGRCEETKYIFKVWKVLKIANFRQNYHYLKFSLQELVHFYQRVQKLLFRKFALIN